MTQRRASMEMTTHNVKQTVTRRAFEGIPADTERSKLGKHQIALGSILVLVALAYTNTLWNGFAFDDILIIQNNPLIHNVRYLPTLFTTHYWEGAGVGGNEYSHALYRPLVLATYMLNALTTGDASWAFHLTNVLIHLAVVLTLYGVACRLQLPWPGALATAWVFAVHPLNTEAVTGIVGRAELMMALCVLLAFYWDLAKNPPDGPATRLSFGCLALFALGLLSKEQALMLPALVIVADAMRSRVPRVGLWQTFWNARTRYLGFFLVAAAYLAVRFSVLGLRLPPTATFENPLGWMDTPLRLLNTVKIDGLYLWLALWPAHLSADYSYNAIPMSGSVLDPAVWGSALSWIGLLALGTVAFYRRSWPLTIGTAITLIFFLPVSNLIVQIGTIMGERLFYLPLTGICLVLGAGWNRACEVLAESLRPRWRIAVAAGAALVVLTPLAVRTITRNRDWANNETLFTSIVRVYPNNAKGQLQLARTYYDQGEAKRAFDAIQKVLAIAPFYAKFTNFAAVYGKVLTAMGQSEKAVEVMNTVLENGPVDDPAIYRALARAHERNHSITKAVAARKRAIELAERVPRTSTRALMPDYNELARLYALQGKMAASRKALGTILERVRGDPDLRTESRLHMTAEILGNMALIDMLDGNYEESEKKYLQVFALLESSSLDDRVMMRRARFEDYARLLRRMGREEDARAIDRKAQSLKLSSDRRAQK